MNDLKEMLQWHPAFYASLQIELQNEADWLIFENEHQLGTKPKQIDVLVIKKENNYPVQKNIGRIFRKHNIIEYKSPTDYLSVDDFYQVYGYACFYKADTEKTDSIAIEELTISFVCKQYPRKLIRHLKQNRRYSLREQEAGIYLIEGDKIPMQLIITSRLSEKENLWLKSLTDELEQTADAERLVSVYKKHTDNTLYRSVMDIIVRANRKKFQEVKEMCTALEELMKDEIEAMRKEIIAEGLAEGRAEGLIKGQELFLISRVQRKVRKNKTIETIACELEEPLDNIRDIYETIISNPGEETEEIYQRLHAAD